MKAMNTLRYQRSYRRKLPHIQPPGATFFITARLAGSLPRGVWVELRTHLDTIYAEVEDEEADALRTTSERERAWFQKYEQYLHETKEGPHWLAEDRLAVIVANALHHFD